MPRGRPDPLGQVADGGRVHLVPDLQILEQDRPQLDEPQGRLASGDDGVHAGTVAVVGADAAVAVAIERGGVAARPAVTLTGDQIDERLLPRPASRTPSLCCGRRVERGLGTKDVCRGLGRPRTAGFGTVYGANPLSPRGKSRAACDASRRIGAPGRRGRASQRRSPPVDEVVRRARRARGSSRRPGRARSPSMGLVRVGEPQAVMPASARHPQHPQHVRSVGHEDARDGCRGRQQDLPRRGSTRASFGSAPRPGSPRAARRARWRRRGRRRPRSSGRRRPCRRSRTSRGAIAGQVQRRRRGRGGRRRPSTAARRTARRPSPRSHRPGAPRRCLALCPDPVRGVARRPGRRRGRRPTPSRSRSRHHRRAPALSAGARAVRRRRVRSVSGRDTSCTSRRSRTSTGRSARSARRSACSRV